MNSFFRLLKILHCIGKYRLLDLIEHEAVLRFRILLFPLLAYPNNSDSRGQRLRLCLEELGPIFIKFGQLLSTRPDLIPEDIVSELTYLQDRVPPFDSDKFKQIVETSLGQDIASAFSEFDHQPLASASIAQVHGACLKDGSKVVVKVVRPNIERVIEQDTRLLGLIARWVERFLAQGKRLRPVEVVRDYRETILDELDLVKEGANASQLRRNFSGSTKLYVPDVHWELTRTNVLVLERIYGIPVNNVDAIKAQGTDLKILAERGVDIFFTQVFEHNFFHADMHPGNVFVSYDNPSLPSYIAVDMAIVGSLNREDQYYLARNLIAMFRRDYRQVAELHVSSGWVPKGTSVAGFESAIRSVCEPIFQKPLKDISFGEALISLFRTAQRFDMPVQPQLVLLQKTLLNIEGLGRQLYPELDLWQTAHPYLERWISNRYHPKTIFSDLKYHAPEWLETLPQIPALIHDTLSEVKNLAAIAPELERASRKISQSNQKRKHSWLLSGVLFGTAGWAYYGLPAILSLPKEAICAALIIAAVIALK